MLTSDVCFEGWTTEDWSRLVRLWKPRAVAVEDEPTRPRGGVIVIHDRKQIRKILSTKTGRVLPPALADTLPSLEAIAAENNASWGLSAEFGALDEVMERFGARLRKSDDLTAQIVELVSIIRDMIDEGAIESWPRRLRGVPLPTASMIDKTLDAVCEDGHAICLGLFDDGALWTSLVLRRRGRGFDLIAGPDELRSAMGLISGDFRRDYRHLERAVEDRYATLSFGVYAEVETFRALQLDARPGAWGRAVAVRDVVVSPVPGAIGLALGVDAARLAFDKAKVVASRVDFFGMLDPMAAMVRKRLGRAAGDKDVSAVLGFDPMAALRALLKR
jgi:hypothetical protein